MSFKKIIAFVLLIGIAYYFLLPEIFRSLITLPNPMKYCLGMIIIAPIAFCMGMPFPHGLSMLSKKIPQLVPLAWGINGYTSVIGAVLATFLAMGVGFGIVFLSAMFSYSVVLVMGSRFAHSPANQI
ncbi:MAG TPA: hypothetical protein VFF29_02795, partial [Bacteroidota bacterium]|nr:hypothetical protein [Bacteroidota bacterium]